tara:strand:+ start:555 stop:3143 length:2589 start_codon:yes stop_codon:yes gene_type:complete
MRVVGNIASDSEVVATADGAITAGKPVVVNADGTVQFAGSTTFSTTVGSSATFESAAITGTDMTFDSNSNRVVITYKDGGNSDYGTAIVGEVNASNNTISFGTPVVFESAATNFTSIDFDSTANKVLIAYEDDANSDYGTAIVGTVDSSDNSISFGSAAVFESAAVQYLTTRFDPDNSKFLIVYEDNGNSDYGTAVVATISGTSVSFGTPTVYASVSTVYNTCIYDTNANKFLVVYRNADVGGYGIVATISGTSVSFGSATGFHTSGSSIFINGSTGRFGTSFDSTLNKIVIAYQAYPISSSTVGYVVVGTISGTSVSFGSYVALGAAEDDHANIIAYDSSTKKHLLMNYDASEDPDHTNIREITVSGTTPTVGDQVLVSDLRESTNNAIVFDSNAKKMVIAYAFGGNSNYGTANVIQTSGTVDNLTSENFIGFAKDNVANGAVATIQTANSIARDNIQQASASDSLSSASTYGAISTGPAMAVDTANNRIVIAGRDGDTGVGKAIVGSIDTSNDTVSFGSFAQFEDGNNTENFAVAFDSSNSKIVIVYSDGADSNNGKAVVGTVSGTSISYGTIVEFDSNSRLASVAFDSNAGKIVIAYADYGNSGYGTAIVGTVSGTDISFGTAQVFKSASSTHIDIAFDSSNNKVVVAYVATHHYGIVGTVSGTSISFGSEAKFADNGGSNNKLAFDSSNNKFLIIYKDQATDDGFGIVGTVSGTSISYGSAVEFHDANTSDMDLAFDTESNKFLIAYKDDGDSDKGKYVTASISGTTPSFGSEAVLDSGRALQPNIEYDSGNKRTVINYRDTSGVGTIKLFRHSGFDEDLTIGQQYFVQTDGTLSTSADSPSVIAGTAISSTDLIVKG